MTARRLSPTCLLAFCVAVSAAACDDAPPPPKELLVIDGMTIQLAELDPLMEFLDSYVPEAGRKAKVLRILEEHLVPLHLARRAFAAERQQALARAEALCSVASNVEELERQSAAMADTLRRHVSRNQPKLPIAKFVFDPLLTRSVSQPIELAHGYVVAACYDIEQGTLKVDDRADTLQVTFGTHTLADWQKWLDGEQKRVADKVTFVHPDYREAMPPWIILPKLP